MKILLLHSEKSLSLNSFDIISNIGKYIDIYVHYIDMYVTKKAMHHTKCSLFVDFFLFHTILRVYML